MGFHFLLQGIFLTQRSKPHLLHWQVILYHWATKEAHLGLSVQFSSFQSLSCVRLFATPWIASCQASLSITNSQSLLKLMPIESVMTSSHLILFRPLLLLSPIPPSIRVFSNESTLCMRWPKYWSFSFSISPSNENPGLISLVSRFKQMASLVKKKPAQASWWLEKTWANMLISGVEGGRFWTEYNQYRFLKKVVVTK